MSLSKLESLPNEILMDILQNYVSGVDILINFLGQLNSRFDALIAQCRWFHINFREIRKTDFLTCIAVLPVYFDKIRSLTLSEWHTPGEANTFLSSFPLFNQFQHLRRLNIHFDANVIDYLRAQVAIQSLSDTSIRSLSIVLDNVRRSWNEDKPQRLINKAFSIPTLKCLSFDSGFLTFDPYVSRSFSTNVEYLNLQNTSIYWVDVAMILSCATHLKYLNIRLTNEASSPRRIFGLSLRLYRRMNALHTFIIHFSDTYATGYHLLKQCLYAMPNLTRLEVSSDTKYIDAEVWEKVIADFLPRLTDFRLLISRIDSKENEISNELTEFQTPFWIEKKNFNVIITTAVNQSQFQRLFYKTLDKQRDPADTRNDLVIDPSIVQLWSAPRRSATDNVFNTINIKNLSLSSASVPVLSQPYFDNVTTLNVIHLNRSWIDWLMAHVNLLKIIDIKVWNCDIDCDAFMLLLSCTKIIISLQIPFNVLVSNQSTINNECNSFKSLDVSSETHTFTETDIKTIAHHFSYIEHLKINTISLYNAPLLKDYLPHLQSLTFKIIDTLGTQSNDNDEQQWASQIQQSTTLHFKRTSDWITIWIDQNTFNETYWQSFQQIQSSNSPIDSETSRKKHKP